MHKYLAFIALLLSNFPAHAADPAAVAKIHGGIVDCVGCNLCSMVCPVDECITMVRVDDGASKHTWREQLSVPS